MSRLYFHSEHGEAELLGAERHYMGGLIGRVFLAGLGPISDMPSHPSWIRKILPPGHHLLSQTGPAFEMFLPLTLTSSLSSLTFVVGDEKIPADIVELNTALALGGDAVKLATRLHAQCEVHCYVEGANRAWLADIIERACGAGVFRPGAGWESVLELLRSRDDGPVVCSHSSGSGFPNSSAAPDWSPPTVEIEGRVYIDEDGADAWYRLSGEEQWRLAMEGLRSSNKGLELTPESWQYPEYYFGVRWTAFDLQMRTDEMKRAEQST